MFSKIVANKLTRIIVAKGRKTLKFPLSKRISPGRLPNQGKKRPKIRIKMPVDVITSPIMINRRAKSVMASGLETALFVYGLRIDVVDLL
jgi:hypothetical protein